MRIRSGWWLFSAASALLLFGLAWREKEDARNRRSPLDDDPNAGWTLATEEAGHGRLAEAPSEIPLRGWRDIVIRVYEQSIEDRLLSVAGGVAFFCLLALFPGLNALVTLYGIFADNSTISTNLSTLSFILPAGAFDIIGAQIKLALMTSNGSLSVQFFFSLVLAIWSANAGIKSIFDGLNVVYEERERRNFFVLNLQSLIFTLLAIIAGGLAIAAVIVAPILLHYVYLGDKIELSISILKWPLLAIFILLALSVLYRFGPSRQQPKWRWVTWGSVVAALLWMIMSVGFSWYVSGFGSYDRTYGALGAIIAFMTWIWLSTTVILLGGELNAEMEHQTARDTTTGMPLPMGERGAVMADTLGKAKTG